MNIAAQTYIDKYTAMKIRLTPLKGKQPIVKGWQNDVDAFSIMFKPTEHNIGGVLGQASDGLVDVDVDCDVARQLAPAILLQTASVFGRPSARRSHYLYRVQNPGRPLPLAGADGMIVELRSTGNQTMLPGSIHPNGEPVEFDEDGEPASADFAELAASVRDLALARIVTKHWQVGKRHNLTLALAGAMAKAGRPRQAAERLVAGVVAYSGDDDLADRLNCVTTTYSAFQAGEQVAGRTKLRELIGDDAKQAEKFLGLTSPTESPLHDQSATGTDASYASLFSADRQGHLVYNGVDEMFYKRSKGIYSTLPKERLSREVISAGYRLFKHNKIQQNELKKFHNVGPINNIINLTRAELYVDHSLFDSELDLVGCRNGVLSLDRRCLIDPGHAIVTKKLGCMFDAKAECPLFREFLETVMPDKTVRDFLQRAMGYTLSGTAQEQCLLVLIGIGANGKSTFANTLAKMMGDYAGTTPMTTLTVQKYNNPAGNDLAELVGKRFVYAAEGEGSDTLAEAKVKWMTGGEPITARKLYKNFFTYSPAFTLWLATNELPRVQGTAEGIWRRFNVIEFPITIPTAKRDHQLSRKLLDELPGILNFALDGYRMWKAEGLNAPPQVRAATNSYRNENDTVQQFIESCCELVPSAKETTIALHSSYELWCAVSGLTHIDKMKFGKEMKRHGYESFHSATGNGWRGLKLKDGTQAF